MMVKPFTIIMRLMTVGSKIRQMPTEIPWAFFLSRAAAAPGSRCASRVAKTQRIARRPLRFLCVERLGVGCRWRLRPGIQATAVEAKLQRFAKQPLRYLCNEETLRLAEPRQSSRSPYRRKPGVSWDRMELQGSCNARALHKVPPSNKYITDFEGA